MNKYLKRVGCTLVASCFSLNAFSAGYEKTILFSGRYSGMASAAAGIVEGAESVYFNPAGLGGGGAREVSLNFSPAFIRYDGPVVRNDQVSSAQRRMAPLFGGFAKYSINEKIAVGVGAYVAGGNRASYTDLDYSPVLGAAFSALKPEARGDLTVLEYSPAVSYKVNNEWSVGAGYRIIQVNGDLSSPTAGTVPAANLLDLRLKNLKDTSYGGYRIGVQYAHASKKFGGGLVYRNGVKFRAKGDSSGTFLAPGIGVATPTAITGGEATVSSELPQQISLGGFYKFFEDKLTVAAQYDFTHYSKDRQLSLEGRYTVPVVGVRQLANSPIGQHLKNQHSVRLGTEYNGFTNQSIRAGVARISQVTSDAYPTATFPPPAVIYSLVAGYGYKFGDSGFRVDGSGDVTLGSKVITSSDIISGTTNKSGKYSVTAYTLHTGVTYAF